jgi:tetratricopeptide (TPR) repeat protein
MSAESPLPPVRAYLEQTDPFTRFMIDARARLDLSHRELAAEITAAAFELNQVLSTIHAPAVWRWEHGVAANEDARRWIAYALQRHGIDVSAADLDSLAQAQKRARRLHQRSHTHVPPVELTNDHPLPLRKALAPEVRGQTNRRTFIIGTGTTVGALLLADHANRADALERLQRALVRPGLDSSTLTYLETRFAGYWHDYHITRLPASELLAYALDDLNKINCLLEKSALATNRAQLYNLTAHAAVVVGALQWDTGAHAQSRDTLQMSLVAARDAGNSEIEAVAHAWLAFGWMYESPERDTWQAALQSIQAGRELCRSGDTLASWLAAIEAEIHSHLGDRKACLTSLRDAGKATDLTAANPQWYWTRFDDAALAGYRGIAHLRLGATAEARTALSEALQVLDSSEGQRRLTLLIDLAQAHAQEGAIDEACAHAIDAVRMAANYQSPVKTRRLLPLGEQLARHHDIPAVRQLQEELMTPDVVSDESR